MKSVLLAAAAAALAFAAPAEAAWRQAATRHFVIYSEEDPKSLADFATRLERYDRAMRVLRGLPDPEISPSNRLTVYVLPGAAAVRKLYGKGGSMVGGFYNGRATGAFAVTPRTGPWEEEGALTDQIVLLHEYAHHFMLNNFVGAFPAWLVEGWAEYHSTASFGKDGSVMIGNAANHRAFGLLGESPIRIETLLTASVSDLKKNDIDRFYGRGWLLTHMLESDPERRGQLGDYLAAINSGVDSLTAARKAFGDLAVLNSDLEKYLDRKSLSGLRLRPEMVTIAPVTVTELSPGGSAIMDLRIRSKRGVSPEQAKALLPQVRKAAAPYPADPLVQTSLAEAEYDAGNFAEAEAAADRAIAADPKAGEAMIFKGRAKIAAAVASGATDAATWKEARKWLLAANRLEPDDPEPLLLYYQSFLEAGAEPTANASLGLFRALDLAPQDWSLRWMAARQHLVLGNGEEARAALAPVAFSPHGGEAGKAAAGILAALASGGTKAALAAFDALGGEARAAENDA